MKTSITVTFTFLFLAVAALYVRLNPATMPGISDPSNVPLRVLPLLNDGGIQWMQIQNLDKKETVTLQKKDGKWRISFPISSPADPMMTEGLATALKLSSKARRLFPERDWDEYGLLKPSIKIGVEAEPGQRRYLYLGDRSPVGKFVFARWEGEKEYFLVQADLKKAFERSLYSLRLKQIFQTPLNEINKIHIRTLNADYEIYKKGQNWFWMEPIPILGKSVPKKQSDEMLAAIADLYVKDFLDKEQASRQDLGFSIASPSVKLWGGSASAEVLKIGREDGTQDAYYGSKENGKTVFLVARGNIRALFQMMETLAQSAGTK